MENWWQLARSQWDIAGHYVGQSKAFIHWYQIMERVFRGFQVVHIYDRKEPVRKIINKSNSFMFMTAF